MEQVGTKTFLHCFIDPNEFKYFFVIQVLFEG